MDESNNSAPAPSGAEPDLHKPELPERPAPEAPSSASSMGSDSPSTVVTDNQHPGGSKKKLWLIIAAVVAVLLVGGGIGWWMMHKNNAKPAPAKAATSNKKTTIVYAVHWLEDQQINGIKDKDGKVVSKGLKQYLDEYTGLHPNVTFSVQQIAYNEYANKLKVLSDSGVAPDIYQAYSPWVAQFVHDGIVAAPPTDVTNDVKQNYISTAGATIDGKIWGIPTEVDNYALLYNKDLFKQAGIVDSAGNAKAPTTWQEVLDDAKKLTKRDSKNTITQYGFSFLRDNDWQAVDPFLSLLFSNKGQYLSSDYKKSLFNSTAGVAALDAEVQLFKNGSTDASGNFYDFKDGKVGMVVSPPWTKANFAAAYGANFSKVVGVTPLPYMQKASTLQYSWLTGVMKDSPNQDESWKFLQWFTEDVQKSGTTRYGDLLANTIGAIPARNVDFNKHKDVLGDFFTSVYVDQMKNSQAEPNVLQSSDIKAALMTEIQAAWDGKKTSKEALDSAATAVDKILAQYYK
ncbi:MAG TPA: extracellular solute-binding protein [Patescibacteria group bacterium]|nr:extracellular solute-binding protein [Patescibacteria group bacterium]